MSKKKTSFLGLDIDSPHTPKVLLFGVLGLWVLSALIILCWWDLGKQGQIGDMFGAVNSLFSGLAFAGIIFSILLQREEWKGQQEQLEITQTELKQQNDAFQIQRFETTFFNMLSMLNEIINAMEGDILYGEEEKEVNRKGRNYLKYVLKSFDERHSSNFSYKYDNKKEIFIE